MSNYQRNMAELDDFAENNKLDMLPTTHRGTSNTNERGGTPARKARRAWIMKTFASDVAGFVRCYRCGCLLYNPDTLLLLLTTAITPSPRPLTIDRIVAGANGGTYRRNNIRPACSPCNIQTGAYVHRSKRNSR